MVLVVVAGVLVIIYNTLITLKNNVAKAWANIDVLLQKRHDMISKLVDAVKGYESYEKSVLAKITSMRTTWMNVQQDSNVQNKMDASNQISRVLKTVFANVENYPDLKADTTFLELQKAIESIEDQIADRREYYNDTVNTYNIKIKIIPFNFFAGPLGYQQMPFFQAPDAAKENIRVDTVVK